MLNINIQLFGGRGASSGIKKKKDNRPETLEERKQAARDRVFNKDHNESATKVVLQKENQALKTQISAANAHKSKADLVSFVEHQTNVKLSNDKSDRLNRKRKVLYTQIDKKDYFAVASLLNKHGFRMESHTGNNYWIYL